MVLADGLSGGRGIAVDVDHVYWTDQDDGSVHRILKGGGDGAMLASDQDDPYDIVVSDGQVYWTNFASNGAIMTVPVGGGAPATLQEDFYPRCLAVGGGQLYWGTFIDASGHLMRMPAMGGAGFIVPPPKEALGSVYATPPGGGPFSPFDLTQLATDVAQPWGIAKQGDTVLWTDGTSDSGAYPLSVLSVAISDGSIQSLASGQTSPWGIAADEQYVYWTDHDAVRAIPLGGGEIIELAEEQDQARSIVVDEQWVFWVTRARVLQRPKP